MSTASTAVLRPSKRDRTWATLGASWLSNLAESKAKLVQDEGSYDTEVPGWRVFLAL